jgi:hypothetical protein
MIQLTEYKLIIIVTVNCVTCCSLHGLDLLACYESKLTSETVNYESVERERKWLEEELKNFYFLPNKY